MTQKQLDGIIGILTSNKMGEYNYKEFIQYVIGETRGEQLFMMNPHELQIEADREFGQGGSAAGGRSTFNQPTHVVNPANSVMGNIG